ncbi:MAG: glycoside hydrolase family 57 protein, partial [Pseudomonadota bacterium]
MIDVLFLWHMHQPCYREPNSGQPVLPSVRLHACSGYLDMARVLERRPETRVTVNLTPSLIEQIEELVAGVRDKLEVLAERNSDSLGDDERQLVIARSFSVKWSTGIDPRPRYAELLAKRGRDRGAERGEHDRSYGHGREREHEYEREHGKRTCGRSGRHGNGASDGSRFTTADIRDLCCLFLLAWLGFAAREDAPAIDELDRKGRDFTEDDKAVLLQAVRTAAGQVVPSWKRLALRGQVELSTSPYYHPIVPLLCDSEIARVSRPQDSLPARFAFPEDALAQIKLAQIAHERTFGSLPKGMWPPEGSLSTEAIALYETCGLAWLAGDEEVLVRSLGIDPTATNAVARARTRHYHHRGVSLFFRNRDLSDRIGFRYSELPAATAVADFLAGVQGCGESQGVVGVFLDGENAWEGYPRHGADFLFSLYDALHNAARAGIMRARTLSDTLADRGPGTNLAGVHP